MNAGRFLCIVFVEVSELQASHSVHAPFCIGVTEASPFPLLYSSQKIHSSTLGPEGKVKLVCRPTQFEILKHMSSAQIHFCCLIIAWLMPKIVENIGDFIHFSFIHKGLFRIVITVKTLNCNNFTLKIQIQSNYL